MTSGEVPPFDVRRAVLVTALTGLIMVVASAGSWVFNGDVPRGATVLGAGLGGRSRTDAENVLRQRAATSAATPVLVRLGGHDLRLDPATVGVRVDVERSVGRAIRGPVVLDGRRDVPPVVDVDRSELRDALQAAAARVPCGRGRGLTAYGKCEFDLDSAVREVKEDWPAGRVAVVALLPPGADLSRLGGTTLAAADFQGTPRLRAGRLGRHPRR